ncbi:hypothetical protein P8452_18361 [Trifolium repens]|nr:hypothetical protein P8452_18361 [Trifolium repens]
MPRKKMGRTRNQKRKNSLDDDDGNNQANQVSLDSDQVEIESPLRYLVSVAFPHNVEPELGHKEAKNVENSTVVIRNITEGVGEAELNVMEEAVEAEPNRMEEEGEGEAKKSLSNHVGKNTFEKESIPLEPESLEGGITIIRIK